MINGGDLYVRRCWYAVSSLVLFSKRCLWLSFYSQFILFPLDYCLIPQFHKIQTILLYVTCVCVCDKTHGSEVELRCMCEMWRDVMHCWLQHSDSALQQMTGLSAGQEALQSRATSFGGRRRATRPDLVCVAFIIYIYTNALNNIIMLFHTTEKAFDVLCSVIRQLGGLVQW